MRIPCALLVPALLSLAAPGPAAGQDETDLAAWAKSLEKKSVAIVYANRLAMAGWKSTPLLVPLLSEGSEEQKKRALWILLRTLDAEAAPALEDMVRRGDEVELACRVLARLRAAQAVGVLVERIEADPAGAEPCVSALGVLGGDEALAALRKALLQPPLAVRAALALLVQTPGDAEARETLAALERGESEPDRVAALWAMGRSHDPHFVPTLEAALAGSAAVRRTAIEALGEVGGEQAEGILRGLAPSPERPAVARALWRAGNRDEDRKRYLEILDLELEQRLASIGELALLPAEEASVRLARFLDDPEGNEEALLEALRVLEGREDLLASFLPSLSRLLGSQSLPVKAYAWMLAERATRTIYEWPSAFERLSLEGGPRPVTLTVGLAHTERLRKTGAMFLPGLSDGVGILFVYPEADRMRIWMKHTYFAIDVAFLDDSGRIVQIASLEPGEPDLESVHIPSAIPENPVRYVLEVRKGWLGERGVGVGDQLVLTPRVLSLKVE